MVRKSIDFELDIDSRKAQRELQKTAEEARDLSDELDDSEISAGEAARAMVDMASRAERELEDVVSAVNALQAEVQGLDRERAVGIISEFKQLGFTAEQIEADIEDVAAAARAVDDVNLKATEAGFDDITHAVSGVDGETRKTRDTMSGFVGGTVGELPLITDAMGPVGEGLGQLAEGALDGEVNFKQLAAAGFAMGGVVVVLGMLNDRLKESAEIDAFQEEQVKAYGEALEDAESTLGAVVQRLQEADELEFKIGGGIDFEVTKRDLLEIGLNAERAAELIEAGPDAINGWAEAASNAGIESDKFNEIILALTAESQFLERTLENQATAAEFMGGSTADATKALEEQQKVLDDYRAALDRASDALNAKADAQRSAVDATFAERDAERELTEALSEVTDELTEAGPNLVERQKVLDDVTESAADLADAEVRVAEETARAAGESLNATQRQDVFTRSLLESASAADGPARRAILAYTLAVADIPEEKATEIELLLNQGRVAEAEQLINETSRTREARIEAVALTDQAEQDLSDLVSRIRRAIATVRIPTPFGGGGRSSGSSSSGGGITGASLTGGVSGASFSSGTPANVVINVPPGLPPDQVAESLRRFNRRNGLQ